MFEFYLENRQLEIASTNSNAVNCIQSLFLSIIAASLRLLQSPQVGFEGYVLLKRLVNSLSDSGKIHYLKYIPSQTVLQVSLFSSSVSLQIQTLSNKQS